MTADIFQIWRDDVFLPAVEEKRGKMRSTPGQFDDRAVLLLEKIGLIRLAVARLLAVAGPRGLVVLNEVIER